MNLQKVETEKRHEEALKKIEGCYFCGSEEFTEIRFEGLFCSKCNAQIKFREPAGDSGSIVTFDKSTVWNNTNLDHNVEREDKKVVQKWLSGDETPYWTSEKEKEVAA